MKASQSTHGPVWSEKLTARMRDLVNNLSDLRERLLLLPGHGAQYGASGLASRLAPQGTLIDLSGFLALEEPVAPFLPFLRQAGREGRLASRLERALYPLHKDLWHQYLQRWLPTSREPLVLEEKDFETGKLFAALDHQFRSLLPPGPVVVFLGPLHQVSCAALEYLQWTWNHNPADNCLFVALLEPWALEAAPELWREAWTEFRDRASDRILTEGGEPAGTVMAESPPLPPALTDHLQQLMHFLCFKDALIQAEAWLARDRDEGPSDQDWETLQVRVIVSTCWMHLGETDVALASLQDSLNLLTEKTPSHLHSEVFRLLGFLAYLKNYSENSQKYSLLALRSSQASGNSLAEVQALFLQLLIDARENSLPQTAWEAAFERFLALCRSLGFTNYQAYWLARPDRLDPLGDADQVDACQIEALRLSRESGNLLRLSAAQHTRGFTFVVRGQYSEVVGWYKKSEKIRLTLGTPLELAYLQNGMGYFLHQRQEYQRAEASFARAYVSASQARDFHEVGMVLCNMGINYLYSYCWDQARLLFEETLKLLRTLGIPGLSYHSQFEIHTLYALALLMGGQVAKARELARTLTDSTLVRAGASRLQSRLEEDLAFIVLQACLARQQGQVTQAEGYFAHAGRQVAGNFSSLGYRQTFVEAARQGFVQPPAFRPSRRRLPDFNNLQQAARAELALLRSVKAYEEIAFLKNLQTLVDNRPPERLVPAALALIKLRFNLDWLVLGRTGTGPGLALVFPEGEPAWPEGRQAALSEILKEKLPHRFPPVLLLEEASDSVGLPGQQWHFVTGELRSGRVGLGLGFKSHGPDSAMLKVLALALSVLGNSWVRQEQELELRRANQQLESLASVDTLTRLNNRMALTKRLQEEAKRLRRHNRSLPQNLSLLFIDLDNFKFYNDTFGHAAGDRILVLFADLMLRSTREVDFISRYGGDEFILVLPETNIAGAAVVAQKIQDRLKEVDFFKAEIAALVDGPVVVPPGKNLGCSIGGAEYSNQAEVEIEELIRRADQALYKSKAAGKGCFTAF